LLVLARVERRLTEIFSLGLSWLIRWEPTTDWKADILEAELMQLLASERQSSSASTLEAVRRVERSGEGTSRGMRRDIDQYKIIKYAKKQS
jgi:hypothetical protein